jgi:hypothetical protein
MEARSNRTNVMVTLFNRVRVLAGLTLGLIVTVAWCRIRSYKAALEIFTAAVEARAAICGEAFEPRRGPVRHGQYCSTTRAIAEMATLGRGKSEVRE